MMKTVYPSGDMQFRFLESVRVLKPFAILRYSLVQLRYYRSDKDRMDQVLLLWPDTQLLMPSSDSWETVSGLLRQQLDAKLAAVDSLTVEAPPPAATAAITTTIATTAVADAKESLVLKLTPQAVAVTICVLFVSCVVLALSHITLPIYILTSEPNIPVTVAYSLCSYT